MIFGKIDRKTCRPFDFQFESSVIHFHLEECFLFSATGCPGGDPGRD